MMEFFQVQELGDGIFCLKDLSTVEMYLVVGEQRAALLDTGTGHWGFGRGCAWPDK